MVFQGAAEKKKDDDLLTDCSSWFRKIAENIELQNNAEPNSVSEFQADTLNSGQPLASSETADWANIVDPLASLTSCNLSKVPKSFQSLSKVHVLNSEEVVWH